MKMANLPRTPKRTKRDLDSGVSPVRRLPLDALAKLEGVGTTVGRGGVDGSRDAVMASAVVKLEEESKAGGVACSLKSSDFEKRTKLLIEGRGISLNEGAAVVVVVSVVGVGHANPGPISELDVVCVGAEMVCVEVIKVVTVAHEVEGESIGRRDRAAASSDGFGWVFPGILLAKSSGSAWFTPGRTPDSANDVIGDFDGTC